MIQIQRSEAPAVLTTRGAARTRQDCEAYEASPDAYRGGTARFKAVENIYGHATVKAGLLIGQYGKCCYCERKLRASDHGDVEHFRPKSAVRQDANSAEEKLGTIGLRTVGRIS